MMMMMMMMMIKFLMNFAVEWFFLLFFIREVSGSNLGPKAGKFYQDA
jgi:hypothetical protein